MSSAPSRKPIAWLDEPPKTPPFSTAARAEAGKLLCRLQDGETLGMPHSRPMPSIGPRCNELRVQDANRIWRLIYRIDVDAIVVAAVFGKKTEKTTPQDIKNSKDRLRQYDRDKIPAKRKRKGDQ